MPLTVAAAAAISSQRDFCALESVTRKKPDGSLTVTALGDTTPAQALMEGEPALGKRTLLGAAQTVLLLVLLLSHPNTGSLRAP